MKTFGEELRSHRERRGLTQEGAAALVGVSRATFTQWEGNKHLLSAARVRELDRALDASGALVVALQAAHSLSRRAARSGPAAPDHAAGPTLVSVLNNVRRALLDQLCFDDDGTPLGWRHNLVPSIERPSIVSTTYGLGALTLLGGPDTHTPQIVDRIMRLGVQPDGTITGWQNRVQREPRMEATAAAINSLLLAGAPLRADKVVKALRQLMDETSRERPVILALAVTPLLRVAPDAEFTAEIVRDLLDCRRDFQGTLLWPEKRLHRDQPLMYPSVAHTARALAVLRNAPAEIVGDAIASAEEWLAEETNLGGVTEIVQRVLYDNEPEALAFHHFTSALVVQALAGAEYPDVRAIGRALHQVWERYDSTRHVWAWGNGDVPVWMLVDAVSSVQSGALAMTTAPLAGW